MPKNQTWSKVYCAAIFIILEIAAISMLTISSTVQEIWLNRAAFNVKRAFIYPIEMMSNYASLKTQNEQLLADNADLYKLVFKYKSLLDSTVTVNSASSAPDGFSMIPAFVVKLCENGQKNYFILNKGSQDGVSTQSGVISSKGILGIITEVSDHYSFGLSIMNSEVSVSARIGHDGDVAPLRWVGNSYDELQLVGLALHTTFAEGDTVWTSGFSSIFPKDHPIGLTGKTTVINGSSANVQVKLFQNHSSVRYVTIVKNLDFDEISRIENEGNEQ